MTCAKLRAAISITLSQIPAQWEQSAAYFIDTHPLVDAFAKNAGLGFSIPHTYNGLVHVTCLTPSCFSSPNRRCI